MKPSLKINILATLIALSLVFMSITPTFAEEPEYAEEVAVRLQEKYDSMNSLFF